METKCDRFIYSVVYQGMGNEALLGVLGIRNNWANYLRDKG